MRCITDGKSTDADFLLRVKEHYTRLLPDYPRFEIAESFFNSVYCRLFDHRSLTPERLFIFSSQPERRFRTIPRPLAKDFFPDTGWEWLLTRVLSDLPLRLPWQNKHRDIHYIIEHLTETLGADVLSGCHLQVANELFYRNKAAWLVGKLITPSGTLPFLLPIHRTDEGELFVDTCLTTTAEASIVFGFARSYFMVYAPLPAALVEWLREILPGKTTAELYMAIGCQKHAKTKAIANICSILPGATSSLLRRREYAAWSCWFLRCRDSIGYSKLLKINLRRRKRCLLPMSVPVINW